MFTKLGQLEEETLDTLSDVIEDAIKAGFKRTVTFLNDLYEVIYLLFGLGQAIGITLFFVFLPAILLVFIFILWELFIGFA